MKRSSSKKAGKSKALKKKPQPSPFPTLQAFVDHGGHIDIGRVPPLECVAIANDESTMYVALQRRRGESLMELLARLDTSLEHCLENEDFIDEINPA